MSPKRRLGKKLIKAFLPILLTIVLAVGISLGLIVYGVTRPPRSPYLVTKESFSQISGQASKVTDQFWMNRDGTQARGWLLRGFEGAPGVILLHRYGTDRSWLFNLGVKLNETTNFTILWPDLRGHGLDPPVKWTSFGVREGDDVLAAVDFLRSVKTSNGEQYVSDELGIYGVELGAFAALKGAQSQSNILALVLDSVPDSSDDLVQSAVKADIGVSHELIERLVRQSLRAYFLGNFQNTNACEVANSFTNRRILLLSGPEVTDLRDSTNALSKCFPASVNLEMTTDLPLTGYNLPSATGEQGERYDRRVIDFFDKYLRH